MSDAALLSKLPSVLTAHAAWLCGDPGGVRAVLRGVELSYADLSGADLRGADLSDADLRDAVLSYADLSYADLSYADLSGAVLRGVNLSYADLSYAVLSDADLSCVDPSGAKGLDSLPFGPVTLPDGAFTAYKLCRGPQGERVIVTLEIPADAERVAPVVGRKCRASRAKVVALSVGESAESWHSNDEAPRLTYWAGEVIVPHRYDPSPFMECAPGLHFFISRREAEEHL